MTEGSLNIGYICVKVTTYVGHYKKGTLNRYSNVSKALKISKLIAAFLRLILSQHLLLE